MPELAEVEITRRGLRPLLRGRRILGFGTDWPRGLKAAGSIRKIAADMRSRKILNVGRRGKVLFLALSPRSGSGRAGRPPRAMALHLGMSGRLEAIRIPSPRYPMRPVSKYRRSPVFTDRQRSRWVHFRWRLSGRPQGGRASPSAGGCELRLVDPRKFGRVWYGAPEELGRDPYLGRLGREPNTLGFKTFSEILSPTRGMVKPFLLRQDKFAGIGNIIADEVLWRARIHPRAPLATLGQRGRRRLWQAIGRTVSAMLAAGGTSIRNWAEPTGRPGGYQERRLAYGRAGEPCPRCRTSLRRIVVAGRGTTICPSCQGLLTVRF